MFLIIFYSSTSPIFRPPLNHIVFNVKPHLHPSPCRFPCAFREAVPENQQPKPGWEWYQPTTISGLKFMETDNIGISQRMKWRFPKIGVPQ